MLLSYSRDGSLPLSKIGERLQVHATSVTNVIDRLEAAGLVRREPNPRDGRGTLAVITADGRDVVAKATAELNAARFGLARAGRRPTWPGCSTCCGGCGSMRATSRPEPAPCDRRPVGRERLEACLLPLGARPARARRCSPRWPAPSTSARSRPDPTPRPGPPPSRRARRTPSVIDITEETFQAEVLDRSFQVPVLLDLWADWCEPCKQLSPILERLADESGGSWILAKIDVDANPRISQALQVQSIPTVFAVIGGQLVPGFQGALPEAQVREFVAAVLRRRAARPAERRAAAASRAGRRVDRPSPSRSPAIRGSSPPRRRSTTATTPPRPRPYEAILASEPANVEAGAGAASGPAARAHRRRSTRASSPRPTPSPADVAAALAAADYVADVGRHRRGVRAGCSALLRRTAGDERDAVRDRLVEYFELIGPDDPRVAPARRELTNALF